MKVAIISAFLLGLTVAQSTTSFAANGTYCALTNETTVCGNFTDACCGTITTQVGTAAKSSVNKCISRHLSEDMSSVSYLTGTTTTTVTYACLNTTRPSTYTVYSKCTNETNCTTSGYCCASFNYTIGNGTS